MQGIDREDEQQSVIHTHDDRLQGGHRRVHVIILFFMTGALIGVVPMMWQAAGVSGLLAGYTAAVAAWLVLRKISRPSSLVSTLLIAASFRMVAFGGLPDLSGDAFRYLWDGRLLSSGLNPYAYTPDDPELIAHRDTWHSRINHPEIPTIYPPWAQVIFLLASVLGGSLLSWRIVLLALDLGTIAILHRFDRRVSLDWATFPLVILEGFWSAHVEIAAVAFLVAAWSWGRARREAWSGVFAALATGVKLVPLFAAPAMLRASSARGRWIAAFATALSLPSVPFLARGGLMPGITDYATRWSFNSPMYEVIREFVRHLALADGLKDVWTAIKDPLHAEAVSSFVYHQLYPEMLARIVLAALIASVIATIVIRVASLERAMAWSIAGALLLSPTIHPWYWLMVLPFALLARERLVILFATLSPLSYLLYLDEPPRALVSLGCYVLPLAVILLHRVFGFSKPR